VHLCRFLGQAENSLACLYITPKGFALHAALLSFSIDALHWCPGPWLLAKRLMAVGALQHLLQFDLQTSELDSLLDALWLGNVQQAPKALTSCQPGRAVMKALS